MDDAFRGFAFDRNNVVDLYAIGHELARTVDVRVRHRAARVRLERDIGAKPLPAGAFEHRAEIAAVAVGECVKKAVVAVEQRPRAPEARLRHSGGAITGLRCPSRVHALRPCAFGQVLDDPGRHAAGDAERVHPLRFIQSERRSNARRRTERAEHRGRVKSRLVHALRSDETQAAHDFATDGNAAREVGAWQAMMLGRGEDGRNDDRAGMYWTTFERVVVVFAVSRRAVAQRGRCDIEDTGVPDQRAGTGFRRRA